jgi:pheromone a factor receptor
LCQTLTYIYAVILSYRLYRYRREFVRLVAARNTTKSRFIRLFIICIIILAAYVPYTFWILAVVWRPLLGSYSWHRVHDPATFNSIIKQPSHGSVSIFKWGQVASGYVLFFVFGTGTDAYNTYKKMLIAMGLGRLFPNLYVLRESGVSTPNSFLNARSWTGSLSGKAKGMFWSRSSSVAEDMLVGSSQHNSLAMVVVPTASREQQHVRESAWLGRIWGRHSQRQTVLPVFRDQRKPSLAEMAADNTHKSDVLPCVEETHGAEHAGVRVFHEEDLDMDEQATKIPANDGWTASVKGGADAV